MIPPSVPHAFRTALATLAAAVTVLLLTSAASADERITSYEVRVEVEPESTLLVTEQITVQSEGNAIKRGIFREFPTLHRGPFGLRKKVTFEVVSVLRDNRSEPYNIEPVKDGVQIRIGDADVFLENGTHTYSITYRTGLQLRSFKTYDELYWNVTGNFWAFPIDHARADVILPLGGVIVRDGDVQPRGFVGVAGDPGNPADYSIEEDVDGADLVFRTERGLAPGEGLTIAVPFGKGVVALADPGAGLIAANWPLLLGALVVLGAIVYHLATWVVAGKDPAPGTIVPLFHPPDGFSPAACRYLAEMGFDQKAFSSAVIGLAVKRALRITQPGEDGSFTLVHSGESPAPLLPDEQALSDSLLRNRESLELVQSNHSAIRGARKKLEKALSNKLENTHFVRNIHLWVPGMLATLVGVALALFSASAKGAAFFMLVWLSVWSVGCAVLVSRAVSGWRSGQLGQGVTFTLFSLPFLAGWAGGAFMLYHQAGIGPVALLVTGTAANILFFHLIKAPTHAGRDVLDEIEGFREYLKVAEEERLNLANPPERTPELFEKFLPYALALDCDQEWSEKFSGVLAAAGQGGASRTGSAPYHPTWYSGQATPGEIATGAFAGALGSSMAASLASSAQSPSSSSGSSGGGFSGGGGGGGGW